MADKYYDMGAMQAFYDKIKTIFQTVANKVTSWNSTPSDDKYPSEKLVKDGLDGKMAIYTSGSAVPSSQNFVCLQVSCPYVSGVNKTQLLLFDITSFADGTIVNNDAAYVGFSGFLIGGKPQGSGEKICVKLSAKVAYSQITSGVKILKSDSATCGPEIVKRTEDGVDKYYLSIFYDSTLYSGNNVLVGQFMWRKPTNIDVYSYSNGVIGIYYPNETYPAGEPLWERLYSWTSNIAAQKLFTARKLKTNLSRTADSTFDGSADQTNIPVTGTLPLGNGGTGKTTAKAAQNALLSNMNSVNTDAPGDANLVFKYASPTDTDGAIFTRPLSKIWTWIKGKLSSDSNVNISGNAATASAAESGSALETAINSKANESEGVYYVTGSSDYVEYSSLSTYTATTSAGPFTSENSCYRSGVAYYCNTAISTPEAWTSSHWTGIPTPILTGTIDGLTALYSGLKIAYKMSIRGGTSSTYLNINNLGNKYIRRNDTNLTTHLPANTVVFLAYDGTYWRWADYDSNTNNWVTTMGAYCDTAAATQAKTATSTNTVYTAGEAFLIRIVNANTYNGKITLNINSQGAKDVWINGAISSSSNKTLPAGEHWCYYDGSVFHIWTDGTAQFKKLKAETITGNLSGNAATASAAATGSALETAINSKQDTITYMTVEQETAIITELGDL